MVVRAWVAKCSSFYHTNSVSKKFHSIEVVEFCSLLWSSLERAHSCSESLLPAAHYPLDLCLHAFPCDSLISWNGHIPLFTEECSAWKRCSCQHHTDNGSGQHQLITVRVNFRSLDFFKLDLTTKKGKKEDEKLNLKSFISIASFMHLSLSTTESIFHGS